MNKLTQTNCNNTNPYMILIPPPDLPKGTCQQKVKDVWSEWLKSNNRLNKQIKRMAPKDPEISRFYVGNDPVLVKVNGVWKQRAVIVSVNAMSGDRELVVPDKAKQDRYYSVRGNKAGKKSTASKRNKKRLRILESKNKERTK